MNRDEMLSRATARREPWDVVVIGGGATGAGLAVDAATRGYDVLLLERGDFGKGTSSRSTKLVHGGVRYLRQGQRRAWSSKPSASAAGCGANAPHLVHDLAFVAAVLRLVGGLVLRPRARPPTTCSPGRSGFGRSEIALARPRRAAGCRRVQHRAASAAASSTTTASSTTPGC